MFKNNWKIKACILMAIVDIFLKICIVATCYILNQLYGNIQNLVGIISGHNQANSKVLPEFNHSRKISKKEGGKTSLTNINK